jgi:hypothetical protein
MMRAGDVLLYTGSSAVDVLVRVVTASTFDHVATALGDGTMLEALPGGVRVSAVRTPVMWLAGPGWTAACDSVKAASVGKPYGYLNDLAAAFGGGTLDEGEIECAQLANSLLRAAGVKVGGNKPEEVFWTVAKLGGEIRYIAGEENAQSSGTQAESGSEKEAPVA